MLVQITPDSDTFWGLRSLSIESTSFPALERVCLSRIIRLFCHSFLFDEPVNNYYHQLTSAEYEELYNNEDVPAGDPFINRPYANNSSGELEQFGHERYTAIVSWVNQRIYKQNTSIHWKLFVFLHNVVPTRCFDLGHKAAFLYIKLLFEACFGSYKEFIYQVTLDPSMLDFLNLALSQKDTPDGFFTAAKYWAYCNRA